MITVKVEVENYSTDTDTEYIDSYNYRVYNTHKV